MRAGPLPARRWIADLVAAGLLLAVPAVGFWPTFGAPGYLVAALGAILLGLGIAALATWRGFGILTTAGITVAAYFLLGGALALSETTVLRVIPTLRTIADLGLQYATRVGGRAVEFTLNVFNLFDRKYWGLGNFGEGRNGAVSVKVDW